MKSRRSYCLVLCVFYLCLIALSNSIQFVQQGPKLEGTAKYRLQMLQGDAVSISGDGNTIAFGSYKDSDTSSFLGAAWVFKRIAGVWSQQARLVGSGANGGSWQGFSVSLSSDGKTLAVGGVEDAWSGGAVWIFVDNNGTWVQQGNKLSGTGALRSARQGWSISLSGDGNTLAVGGPNDGTSVPSVGAVWIFIRTGTSWTQQGPKLVAASASVADFGFAVALSKDGNTLVAAGSDKVIYKGGVWIFVRTGSTWLQQGPQLGQFFDPIVNGYGKKDPVAISGDGNLIAFGVTHENQAEGAVHIYSRTGTVWTKAQQINSGFLGGARFGATVSLSESGNLLVVGIPNLYMTLSPRSGGVAVYEKTSSSFSFKHFFIGYGSVDSDQGNALDLSGDGTTVAVGAPEDDQREGAVWVFISNPPPPVNPPINPPPANPPPANAPTSSQSKGTCFHEETEIEYNGKKFSLQQLQDHLIPECFVPHVVSAVGLIVSADCEGYIRTLRVTSGHLVFTERGLKPAKDLKIQDVVFADINENTRCKVSNVEKEEGPQRYFGLNCIQSAVLASGIKASTFEKLHEVPSFWMAVMGRVLGIKRASLLGEYLEEFALKTNIFPF